MNIRVSTDAETVRSVRQARHAGAFGIILSLGLGLPAIAGPVQDGEAAFAKGQAADINHDHNQAVVWYRKAADLGNPQGEERIGNWYELDVSPPDYTQAMAWYRKAAAQGNAEAEKSIGEMYCDGKGVTRDGTQAVAWYRKAAAGRDRISARWAEVGLGTIYSGGYCVPRDDAQALFWYENAYKHGDTTMKDIIDKMRGEGITPSERAN